MMREEILIIVNGKRKDFVFLPEKKILIAVDDNGKVVDAWSQDSFPGFVEGMQYVWEYVKG